jgi:hypothetical protein
MVLEKVGEVAVGLPFLGFEISVRMEPRILLDECGGGRGAFFKVGVEKFKFGLEDLGSVQTLGEGKGTSDVEGRKTEVNGVEGARADWIVGARVTACVIEGEELDAVEVRFFAPVDEGDKI